MADSVPESGRLRVAHALAPAAVGGLESVVRTLSAAQAGAGLEVEVLLIVGDEGAPPALTTSLRSAGVRVHELRLGGRAYLREFRAVQGWLREHRPEVLHTHGYRVDVIAGRAARGIAIPTVSTLHGFTGGDWKNRCYERIQLHTLRKANAVVAVSRPIHQRLLTIGFAPERVHLIPNAFAAAGTVRSRDAARAELGLPAGARVIGWVGRLSREKGADVLLDALARISDSGVTVGVVGDGACRSELEAHASRLGVGQRVRWLGLVPDAGALVTAFDLFVLSSRTEGTPIALLEAMAAGIPVVATAVGGVPDVVTAREAILVPAEDPEALARGIEQAFADPAEAAVRATAAARRLASNYGVGPWVSRHTELYSSILARHRAGVA